MPTNFVGKSHEEVVSEWEDIKVINKKYDELKELKESIESSGTFEEIKNIDINDKELLQKRRDFFRDLEKKCEELVSFFASGEELFYKKKMEYKTSTLSKVLKSRDRKKEEIDIWYEDYKEDKEKTLDFLYEINYQTEYVELLLAKDEFNQEKADEIETKVIKYQKYFTDKMKHYDELMEHFTSRKQYEKQYEKYKELAKNCDFILEEKNKIYIKNKELEQTNSGRINSEDINSLEGAWKEELEKMPKKELIDFENTSVSERLEEYIKKRGINSLEKINEEINNLFNDMLISDTAALDRNKISAIKSVFSTINLKSKLFTKNEQIDNFNNFKNNLFSSDEPKYMFGKMSEDETNTFLSLIEEYEKINNLPIFSYSQKEIFEKYVILPYKLKGMEKDMEELAMYDKFLEDELGELVPELNEEHNENASKDKTGVRKILDNFKENRIAKSKKQNPNVNKEDNEKENVDNTIKPLVKRINEMVSKVDITSRESLQKEIYSICDEMMNEEYVDTKIFLQIESVLKKINEKTKSFNEKDVKNFSRNELFKEGKPEFLKGEMDEVATERFYTFLLGYERNCETNMFTESEKENFEKYVMLPYRLKYMQDEIEITNEKNIENEEISYPSLNDNEYFDYLLNNNEGQDLESSDEGKTEEKKSAVSRVNEMVNKKDISSKKSIQKEIDSIYKDMLDSKKKKGFFAKKKEKSFLGDIDEKIFLDIRLVLSKINSKAAIFETMQIYDFSKSLFEGGKPKYLYGDMDDEITDKFLNMLIEYEKNCESNMFTEREKERFEKFVMLPYKLKYMQKNMKDKDKSFFEELESDTCSREEVIKNNPSQGKTKEHVNKNNPSKSKE